jgi:F0F1-type ATP synthase alpha subunit
VNETDTRSQAKVYRGKKTKKIYSQDNYEKSSFKDIIVDIEGTKNNALETVSAKVKKEQIPSDNETIKEILYGDEK